MFIIKIWVHLEVGAEVLEQPVAKLLDCLTRLLGARRIQVTRKAQNRLPIPRSESLVVLRKVVHQEESSIHEHEDFGHQVHAADAELLGVRQRDVGQPPVDLKVQPSGVTPRGSVPGPESLPMQSSR